MKESCRWPSCLLADGADRAAAKVLDTLRQPGRKLLNARTSACFSFRDSSLKPRSVNWGTPLNSIPIRGILAGSGRLCCAEHDPVACNICWLSGKFGDIRFINSVGARISITQFPLASRIRELPKQPIRRFQYLLAALIRMENWIKRGLLRSDCTQARQASYD